MSGLLLRPWKEADASGLRQAIDEDIDHLRPWMGWMRGEPATLSSTVDRLADWVEQFRSGRGFRYAIVRAEQPAVILGGANLNCRFGPTAHDVGYWVRRSAIGQGIAGSAAARLIVYAFSKPHIERLVIQSDVGNDPSAGMAWALGFEYLESVTITYDDGSPRPIHRFEMKRSGFAAHETRLRDRSRNVRMETEDGTWA